MTRSGSMIVDKKPLRKIEPWMKAAGWLEELEKKKKYRFRYKGDYSGPAVSLTMPISKREYEYDSFPPFFDGLLPEGNQLEGLLKQAKLDRNDYFGQLVTVTYFIKRFDYYKK